MEDTDHVVVAQGLRGRGLPRRSHDLVEVVEVIPRAYIYAIAICRSTRYGGLISVDALLMFSSRQKCFLSEKVIWIIR